MEGAILWQQSSGERRALSYQAFTLARKILDQDLRVNRRIRKPRAVIVDLDETILDNEIYEGMQVKNGVNRFILLPNAMYGNWVSAIYDNNSG